MMVAAHSTPILDHPAFIPSDLVAEFCVEDCLECMRACERAAQFCLRGMPLTSMIVYRQMMLEGADLVMRTAHAIARRSADMIDLLQTCTEFCTAWARECTAFDSAPFRECAEACRSCAESCREVLQSIEA